MLLSPTQQVRGAGSRVQAISPKAHCHMHKPWCLQNNRSVSTFIKMEWCWPFFRAVVGLNKIDFGNQIVSDNKVPAHEGHLFGRIHRCRSQAGYRVPCHTPLTMASESTIFLFILLFSFCLLFSSTLLASVCLSRLKGWPFIFWQSSFLTIWIIFSQQMSWLS